MAGLPYRPGLEGGFGLGGGGGSRRAPRKVKVRLKKSKARKKAEEGLKEAKSSRKHVKRLADAEGQRLGRTPKKRAKSIRQAARGHESFARKYPAEGDGPRGRTRVSEDTRRLAQKIEAGKDYVGTDKSARSKLKGHQQEFVKSANKKVVQARKKLAKTPARGGKYRVGTGASPGGRRTHFLGDH